MVGEENEPEDIKEDGAEKENGVSAAKRLAAAFNGDQSE